MSVNTVVKRAVAAVFVGGSNPAIREGRRMAEAHGDKIGDAIGNVYEAESAECAAELVAVQTLGKTEAESLVRIDSALTQAKFDAGQHLRAMSHARIDLVCAIGLVLVSGSLTLIVLLAFGPTILTLPLALLVLATCIPVEEFFAANAERAVLRQAVFLVLSVLALAAQFYLASLRGVFGSALAPSDAGPVTHMLRNAVPILRFGLGVLGVVAECVTGFLLFRAKQALFSPVARLVLARRKCAHRLAELACLAKGLETQAEVNKSYRLVGASEVASGHNPRHLRDAAVAALIALLVLLGLFLLLPRDASAAPLKQKTVAAVIDVSKSTTQQDHAANIQATSEIINRLGAGDRMIVIGITGGFEEPLVLLDRLVPSSGYLDLQLKATRELLAAEWRESAKTLKPAYGRTDILGSLSLLTYLADSFDGSEIFVFSDLRQNTRLLNFERMPVVDVEPSLRIAKKANAIPSIKGASVYLLGVEPKGKTAQYFASLKQFWTQFFAEAGAQVCAFNVGRRLPE